MGFSGQRYGDGCVHTVGHAKLGASSLVSEEVLVPGWRLGRRVVESSEVVAYDEEREAESVTVIYAYMNSNFSSV